MMKYLDLVVLNADFMNCSYLCYFIYAIIYLVLCDFLQFYHVDYEY